MHYEDEIQGLVVERDLTTKTEQAVGVRHYRVQDERSGLPHPPHRDQYSFPDPEQKDWGKELQARLDRLYRLSLRHIARPREVGKLPGQERIYVLSDYYEHTLAIGDNGLANDPKRSRAWKLFAQIVEGVDSLHQVDMPHGALCPEKIGVDERTDTAWICSTASAPLGGWTHGEYVDTDARPYVAPENRDKSFAPSVKADLYALGRIGIEMVAGKQDGDANPDEETHFAQALKGAGIDQPRRKLLLSLTSAEPEKRPTSAREVLRSLRRTQGADARLVLWVKSFALAVVLILLAFFVLFSALNRREAAQLNAQLRDCGLESERQLEEKRTELGKMQRVIAPLQIALADARKEIDQLKKGQQDTTTAAEIDRKAVEEAARLWQEYAGRKGLKFENLRHVFQDDDSIFFGGESIRQKARTMLRLLLAQFEGRNGGTWELRFNPPKCEEGKPCVRGLRIYVDGTLVDGGDRDLRSATEPFKVPIDWRADQPIRIVLCDFLPSEGRTWKTGFLWPESAKWIDRGELEFTGPVALWQLKKQTLRAGTDGPAIDIETDCPGPMPRLQFDPIKTQEAAKLLLQEKQADTRGKNR